MPLQLRDSQRVALARLTEPGRHYAALWAEPRSGKTAVALKWLEHVKPEVAVIVGPKIAEATWKTEAAKWLEADYKFFPLTAGNEYPDPFLFRGITLLFVNYEQFGKSPWKRLSKYLATLAKITGGRGAMLLDESHMIKTPNSVTGRNIRPLASKWYYRLLMTGTPVTNPDQVDAVYGQWTFLNPGIRDRWPTAKDFREYFGEWTTVKGYPELVRPRHQAELNSYIQDDVVTMVGPGDPVPIHKVRYRVPADVLELHKVMLKKGVFELAGRDVVGLNPLVRLLRMRTLVAGWVKGTTRQRHDRARRCSCSARCSRPHAPALRRQDHHCLYSPVGSQARAALPASQGLWLLGHHWSYQGEEPRHRGVPARPRGPRAARATAHGGYGRGHLSG